MRNFKELLSSFVVAAALSAMVAATARADTVYTYTGNDFTFAVPPYAKTDSITGSFTVSTPLSADLVDYSVPWISFSFTDGVYTITNTNYTSIGNFYVSTDASGNIIADWAIVLYGPTDSATIGTVNDPSGIVQDLDDNNIGEAFNTDDAGTWTTTPLPAALPLFATGLGAMGLFGWRRKRKNAAVIAA